MEKITSSAAYEKQQAEYNQGWRDILPIIKRCTSEVEGIAGRYSPITCLKLRNEAEHYMRFRFHGHDDLEPYQWDLSETDYREALRMCRGDKAQVKAMRRGWLLENYLAVVRRGEIKNYDGPLTQEQAIKVFVLDRKVTRQDRNRMEALISSDDNCRDHAVLIDDKGQYWVRKGYIRHTEKVYFRQVRTKGAGRKEKPKRNNLK